MCAGRAHFRGSFPNVTAAGHARHHGAICWLGSCLVNSRACDSSLHRLKVGHSTASHRQQDVPVLEDAPGI